jgi:hypothetical protein
MKLENGIRQALLVLIEDTETVVAWGISDINITTTQIRFSVNGFRYSGQVIISVNDIENTLKVNLQKDIEFCCPINELVELLDPIIERTDTYIEDLRSYVLNHFK